MGRRSKYSPEFKAKVAIEAIKERETLTELAKRFEICSSKIISWKEEFLKNSSKAFAKAESDDKKGQQETQRLYAKIGQLQTEVDFLRKPARMPVSNSNETARG